MNALSELEGNSSALVERYKTLYSNSGINLTTEELWTRRRRILQGS